MSSAATTAASAADRWDRRLTVTIAVLCGALFLDAMDVSSVNIALPTIGRDLRMSAESLPWIVSGYALGYGGFLLLGGRAADLLGRRRVFLAALAVFAVTSALGGVVDDGTLLIGARFIKGVSAAFTVPAGLSILTTTFPEGPARNKALGVYAATGAAGFSLGLVIGGLLSELGWRYVFLVPAPVAALLLLVGLTVLDADEETAPQHRHYDLLGALTATGAMLALVFSVVEAPTRGWADARTLGGLALSAVLLGAFVVAERRSPHPLLRLGILRSRTLVSANVAVMLLFGAYLGFQFLATLYIQQVAGWSPVETGLAFLPGGALLLIFGSQSDRIIGRFGTPRLIIAGLIAYAAGYALFMREDSHQLTYVTMFLPTMVGAGLGWGLAFPSLNVQATAGVAAEEQGLAAGLFNTSFQIGGAVGLAVISAVLTSHVTTERSLPEGVLAAIRPGMAIAIAIAVAGAAVVGAMNRPRRSPSAIPHPPESFRADGAPMGVTQPTEGATHA